MRIPFKGEVYHSEEVQLMLAKEAEEDRKRRDEELAQELADEEMASKEEGKRKKRGILIANWSIYIGGLKIRKKCNFWEVALFVRLPQKLKSMFFLKISFEVRRDPEGACGVKKFFSENVDFLAFEANSFN